MDEHDLNYGIMSQHGRCVATKQIANINTGNGLVVRISLIDPIRVSDANMFERNRIIDQPKFDENHHTKGKKEKEVVLVRVL